MTLIFWLWAFMVSFVTMISVCNIIHCEGRILQMRRSLMTKKLIDELSFKMTKKCQGDFISKKFFMRPDDEKIPLIFGPMREEFSLVSDRIRIFFEKWIRSFSPKISSFCVFLDQQIILSEFVCNQIIFSKKKFQIRISSFS